MWHHIPPVSAAWGFSTQEWSGPHRTLCPGVEEAHGDGDPERVEEEGEDVDMMDVEERGEDGILDSGLE